MRQLPAAESFAGFRIVDLDTDGVLVAYGGRVPPARVPERLASLARVPPHTTDIIVFVHGWQNSEDQALSAARRLFSATWELYRCQRDRYRALREFRPYFIAVRWPSTSSLLPSGYRRIRDRAHAMTDTGHAAHVIGALLGYLDNVRLRPRGPNVLHTASGQYLHCVGHSFGGRLLGEAITWAASPPQRPTLEWPWTSAFALAVDSFLVFQLAAPPQVFTDRFGSLVARRAPIVGPVVLTFSQHDRALSKWHRVMEGRPGIGAVGAAGFPQIRLRRLDEDYRVDEFAKVTNVDASWLFRRGRLKLKGAHSDIWYPESAHLLLSLANLSR